jgi:Family of unknown function (DUF5701)
VGFDTTAEFDRQVDTLLKLGYPALAGLSAADFGALLDPLRAAARACGGGPATPDRVPFVVVVPAKLVPTAAAMPLTALRGRPGTVSRLLADVDRFVPTEHAPVPTGEAYLLVDVQRGAEFRGQPPDAALPVILGRGRSPLTVDEGVALVTQFPTTLVKNHCFSLAGSRCEDRRVPAVWISKGAPMLGWCWAGNPHTWLGSASCAGRAGPDT